MPELAARRYMIELRQLRYLIATAEAGSFSRAARQLNIKQATLSRQILSIEKRLGLKLFERVSRGAILTREGEHYLDVARRVVDDFAEINAWVKASRSGVAGQLGIGFYTSLSAGNLRATLAEFSASHPDIEIKRFERDRRLLLAGLHSGAIDIAIMIGEAAYAEFQRRSLWSERLLIALAGEHPLLGADHIRWPDLADERFLLPNGDPGPELARIIGSKLARADMAPDIVHDRVSGETILSTVALGRHVTIVSEGSVGNRIDGVRYREIDDRDGETRIGFSGYWREDNPNPVLRTFLDLVTRRYAFPV